MGAETSGGSRDLYIVPEQIFLPVTHFAPFKELHLRADTCSHGNSHDGDEDDDQVEDDDDGCDFSC